MAGLAEGGKGMDKGQIKGARAVKLSRTVTWGGLLALVALLAACEREEILPGQRFGLREALPAAEEAAQAAEARAPEVPENRAVAIRLPAQVNHGAWTHRAGEPDHSIQHPALSPAPQLIWAAKIGQGNDRRHRITADPVVAGGRIFTLDSRARVVATSSAGATLWQADLTPAGERADDVTGGGLAIAGERLFVTTGFGALSALDAADGSLLWTQQLTAPASGAPTVSGGLVFVADEDNTGYALDAATGRIRWQLAGTPDLTAILGASSPAIAGQTVLFPFSSGELVAAATSDGTLRWRAHVAGARPGRGYSNITDITGEPVVAGGTIYAGNSVGRTVALDLGGRQIWSAEDGATGPVWVAGGSVFLISDEGRLVRLDARSGERIWAVELPYFTKQRARRRKAIYANYGPVLAGGLLWVASSDGRMRAFDPVDGALVRAVEIPGGASTRPVVVDRVAYVVSTRGQLLALR